MSLEELKNRTVEELTNKPENNYVSILVLRELESNAVFTTNGVDADIGTISIEEEEYNPVLMFMRKQSGSDRRYGKSMQRELLNDVECTMNVNEMCQKCPECVLFGSAASEGDYDISITSRVLYDTAYSLRDSNVVVEEKFQNAPGDSYSKEATSGIREPDFVLPGTMFPSVITLKDATPEEVAFVLSITLKNKRYGATSSRQGRTKNHILGIYQGNEEPASNLALTKRTINKLGNIDEIVKEDTIPVDKAKKAVKKSFDEILEEENIDMEELENKKEILKDVRENIEEYLKNQQKASKTFIENQVS
ncbi:type I-D CRISPR-associated protein Cas7/Csc2 [Methanonatronarchaeum sp. AMET-Sl]|uniref:type I-D CRISPR-associated protein Cas7/Csc2 n=1 Tax=Methanonatronarchaeum sp. AMET-Sl TaxID=3037654 RepID=UPI00244DDC7E|nr:type I-D CRISPR-associated protein Cas7/Csc2 [Methanonatronarchaeum sp. AMET-Sl]WGI17876.1 type I-D CRISPR-associated protein Cas7/Csc2 [Methanonatronarchaeum sp. AMET-Sl]